MSFRCKVFVITHWQNDVEAICRLADVFVLSRWTTTSQGCNNALRARMCEFVYAHMNIILGTEVTFNSYILFIIVGLQME